MLKELNNACLSAVLESKHVVKCIGRLRNYPRETNCWNMMIKQTEVDFLKIKPHQHVQ